MIQFRTLLVSSLILLSCSQGVVLGAQITDWEFSFTVVDRSNGGFVRDIRSSSEVQNPFTDTFNVSLSPAHTATSNFDISWTDNTGTFLLDFVNSVPLGDRTAGGGGDLTFETTQDLLLDVAGGISYHSAAGEEANFRFEFAVIRLIDNTLVYNAFHVGGDGFLFQPASGSFAFDEDSLLLPGGSAYEIRFSTSNMASNFPNGTPNTTDGFFEFNYRPVPEPHTACLLLIPAAIATVRPRR